MKILYISKIDGRPWIGPSYSVPCQVEAQSNYDEVFWYNLIGDVPESLSDNIKLWRKKKYYHDLIDYPNRSLKDVIKDFKKPDLIIVEQGYPFAKEPIRKEIFKSNIPYIVIPRGELTSKAQKKKHLKKLIANFVLGYYKFIRKAIAVQCLTIQEKSSVDSKWNNNLIVIPNGANEASKKKTNFNNDNIVFSFIGRLEPFQKGIDLLIEACSSIKDDLENNNCIIDLYGAYQETVLSELKNTVKQKQLQEIILFHEPVYGMDKEKVLLCSDVFLIPSRFEGHPTGLLEALTYGLPCVATSGSNMREEIDEYNAGWTADNTSESIRKALLCAIHEKNQYITKSKNAISLSKEYDWNALARKSHDQYQNLLNELK